MKTKLNCALLVMTFCFFAGRSVAQVQNNRFSEHAGKFVQTKIDKGSQCGSQEGVMLSWKNVSAEPMDLQYAIQRPDGSWHVRSINNIAPDATVENIEYCKASGTYKWWARPSKEVTSKPFPSVAQIKAGTF